MSVITALVGGDGITSANSMAKINANFSALNTDKMETSVLDTDNTLAANSDAKVATQKAVKAYVDAGGNVNASETTRGIVEEATDAEVTAGTATGGTTAKLFITPAKLATRLAAVAITKLASGTTTKNLADASATQNIAHGLAVVPRLVRIRVVYAINSANSSGVATADATYYGTTQSAINTVFTAGTFGWTSNMDVTFIIYSPLISNAYQTGTITTDATNIKIAWVKTGSPTGTAQIIWEAEA